LRCKIVDYKKIAGGDSRVRRGVRDMAAIEEAIIRNISAHSHVIKTRFHVESLAIFGSVSKGTMRPDSDVDILVRYQETPGLFAFLELKKYLEGVLGRPVDLVTEGALKKQLRQHIMQEAVHVT
jgi:hypothetical protein